MVMMDDDDLVISTKNENLLFYTKDGTLKTFKSFSPLKTLEVLIKEQNKQFVGLIDSDDIDSKPESVRKIIILNQSGDIKHTYEYAIFNQTVYLAMEDCYL